MVCVFPYMTCKQEWTYDIRSWRLIYFLLCYVPDDKKAVIQKSSIKQVLFKFSQNKKVVIQKSSIKQVLFKFSQNSQVSTCARASF